MVLEQHKNYIIKWLYDRGIAQNAKPLAQAIKMLEEVTEVLESISLNDTDNLELELGDVFVTLLDTCEVSGIDIDTAVERAYNKIKNRTGYLRADGVFIKDKHE